VVVVGATQAAVLFEEGSGGVLRGSTLRDNAGPGVVVRPGAAPQLRHNVITANGKQPGKPKPGIELQDGARAVLFGNIVAGNGDDQVAGLPPASRPDVLRDNVIGLPVPVLPSRRAGTGAVRTPSK
jgi:hypothetical protein